MSCRHFIAGRGPCILLILAFMMVPVHGTADVDAPVPAPSATPPSVQTEAQSPLGDRRLFFTPQQRHDATAGPNPVAEHGTDVDTPEGQPASDAGVSPSGRDLTSRRSEGSGLSTSSDSAGVYFDGFVSGPRGTRLLVNGLPCLVRGVPLEQAGQKSGGVDCPAVTRSRPRLSLALVRGRLQVSRGKSVMGLLRPGQGL